MFFHKWFFKCKKSPIFKCNKSTLKIIQNIRKFNCRTTNQSSFIGKKPFVNIISPSKVIEENVSHDYGQRSYVFPVLQNLTHIKSSQVQPVPQTLGPNTEANMTGASILITWYQEKVTFTGSSCSATAVPRPAIKQFSSAKIVASCEIKLQP